MQPFGRIDALGDDADELEVQRPSSIAAFDRDRLARVEPDAHGQRQLWFVDRLLDELLLQVDREPNGLARRREHREGHVTTELDHLAAASGDDLAGDAGELGRELGGHFVAALLREQGPAADVGDQEGADLSLFGLDARPARLLVHQPPRLSGERTLRCSAGATELRRSEAVEQDRALHFLDRLRHLDAARA
ncbi:MAG: hypothetical protein ACXWXG_09285, partial [Actinomycetota bacterium]